MKKLFFIVLIVSFGKLSSQDWPAMMNDPNANFYGIQKAFNEYLKNKDPKQKGSGYKAFKRWEYFVEQRVAPSGNLSLLNLTAENFRNFLNNNALAKSNSITSSTPAWSRVGPYTSLQFTTSTMSGRMDFIRIDPTNSNVLYSGSPTGGLWKSTDGGVNWVTLTDTLLVTGCADLAIDPSNPNILYLATGDGVSSRILSHGVLKSTNGGLTWTSTGLTYSFTTPRTIKRLIINPNNPQILLAATSSGIYRTTNGGTSWSPASVISMNDLEFKPGNPNVVFAGGTSGFYRSVNGGASFSQITASIPTTGIGRMAIGVSKSDSNYVYAITCNNTNYGLQGFYRSTNGGTSFSIQTTTINLVGYTPSGTGGQGWYNLCIDVSPSNKDEVMVGGILLYRTTDGGASWSPFAGNGPNWTHYDQHDVVYSSPTKIYTANDGGLSVDSGTYFSRLTRPNNISEIYKMGLSGITSGLLVVGQQDNGTAKLNGNLHTWLDGGDGMECFFDRTNDNVVFVEEQNGWFLKSTNGGASFGFTMNSANGAAAWVTPWKQDPVNASRIYAGRTEMWVSNNLGATCNSLTALPSSPQTITEFAIAPSNNQVIYVVRPSSIFKTVNGGVSWTIINGTLPLAMGYQPTYITIDPADENNAWLTFSGFSAGNKIFETTDGGATWNNVSYNLPNLPANCTVYQPGTNDAVYVGMDAGVYYKNAGMSTWLLYNKSLPNVPVSEMEISPAAPTKLYAATYGRGMYVTDLFTAPVTNFSVSSTVVCSGDSILCTDLSTNAANGWAWSVTPSAGVVITNASSQNPKINFNTAGTYTVSLTASNVAGPGNGFVQVVSVDPPPALNITANTFSICIGDTVMLTASGAASYTWSGGENTSVVSYTPTASIIYTLTGQTANCFDTSQVSIIVNACVGINELSFDNSEFEVFPNPFTNSVNIMAKMGSQLAVYNALGELVYETILKQNRTEIDLSGRANGIYFLKIVNNRTSLVKKAVKGE